MLPQPVASSQTVAPNFGKLPSILEKWHRPWKPPFLRGMKWHLNPIFPSASAMYVACTFCKKNWPKLAKYDSGSCFKKPLPPIGGHHPVPSLSSLQQRDGYSNVLDLPPSPSVLKDPKYARSNRVLTFFFQNRSQSFYCSSNAPALYNFTYLFLEKPL